MYTDEVARMSSAIGKVGGDFRFGRIWRRNVAHEHAADHHQHDKGMPPIGAQRSIRLVMTTPFTGQMALAVDVAVPAPQSEARDRQRRQVVASCGGTQQTECQSGIRRTM